MCKARVRTEVFLQRTGAELQRNYLGASRITSILCGLSISVRCKKKKTNFMKTKKEAMPTFSFK